MSDQEHQPLSLGKGKAVEQEPTLPSSSPNLAGKESISESQSTTQEQDVQNQQQQPSPAIPSSSSSTQAQQPSKCANCSNASPQKPCPKCQSTFYCSRECTKAHWKAHKKICASAAQAFLQNKDLKMASRSVPKKDGHRGGLQKWQFDT